MQKIDFVKNLETIVEKLQSATILSLFKGGFGNPGQAYPYNQINPLLFLSKSNYDQIKNDAKYSAILASLGAQHIYEESNLAVLTTYLVPQNATGIITRQNAVALFNFHNTLVSTLTLSKEVLISRELNNDFQTSIDSGVIVFQIIIEKEGLETEKYIKIFFAFQELIETVSKIVGETDQKPEIILLDSGSDTNVGIKSGVETAKSLFLIFKEIWDFVTNFRHYKQNQKGKALLESLSIRAEILKKVEEQVITEAEGLEYTHMIKTRTDDLIGMKVLPKQIVLESNSIDNKKLLTEFEGLKMLTGADDK